MKLAKLFNSVFKNTSGSVPSVLTKELYCCDLNALELGEELVNDLSDTIRAIQSMCLDEFSILLAVMILVSPDRGG